MNANKFFIFIILSFAFSVNSFSQVSTEWISTYNFSSEDAKAMVLDKAGNVYVTGSSGGDYATVKYNTNGSQLWAARYNGTGNSTDGSSSIAVDNAGNVYVTGGSIGVTFNSDYATVKYNSSGVQQWVARFNGSGNNLDEAFSVAVDSSGNVYVTGGSTSSASLNDYVTIKYNSSGVLQWARSYNGTGNNADFGYRLVLDGSANVYVTGWSRGSGATDEDYVTIKYTPSGDSTWVRRYGGRELGYDQPRAIAVDAGGNVYVTGKSEGIGSSYDYATIKYNSSGDSLWVKRFNGIDNSLDAAGSVATDTSGNVYVSGQSYSTTTNYDFVTIKYNSSGVQQWLQNFNGPGNSVDNEFSMALDKSGNVYVTGSSNFTGQNYNYATVKYSSSGIHQWSRTYNGTASGSDEAFSIAADTSGNIYVTGGSAGLGQAKDFVTIKYSQKPYAVVNLFIEGFYNSSLDKMTADTVRMYVRNSVSPYSVVDSSLSKLDSAGTGRFYFSNISNGTNYYIILKHRNSIETWSSTANIFTSGVMNYDFTTSSSKAFGNNQVQIDDTPLRYAVYSGDVNQDGNVNLTDVVIINNDAANFITGYKQTDVNGDNFVTLTDLIIAYNNSSKFVSLIRP